MYSGTEPAILLLNKAVFVVVDADSAERTFREVEDLVAVGRPFAGDQVGLVIAVEMHFIVAAIDRLALLKFGHDVRVAGGGYKGREPVKPREDAILDFAWRH